MNNRKQIQYIRHGKIDSGKWNNCIENAPNRRIYALDWHLDHTVEIWDALIFGDYEYVMPLTVKKKLGFKYLIQPLFSQQLGIFPNPPDEIAQHFYDTLTRQFRYFNIQLNSQNQQVRTEKEIEFVPRKNFVLPLMGSFSEIQAGYSTNTKRNLVKAQNNRLNFVSGISIEEFMDFKKANLPVKLEKMDLQRLKSIIAYGQFKGFGKIYGVFSAENELCAAVYFCYYKERVTYMNAATNEQGKELGAMIFLVDSFIRENAGNNVVIDFEGSMIPGVARFYQGFGASEETYFQLKYNDLPLLLKTFKRELK
jgi:hypothetical protein